MKLTRKEFLKLAGLAAVGAGAGKLVRAIEPAAAAAAGPATGGNKRWGMAVDFMKCRREMGCDLCVTSCRAAHNIPQIPDPAHEVKWDWKGSCCDAFPYQQSELLSPAVANHVLPMLCNHCADPACTRVCPTRATWKREEDGIVMMDWHRCIGCRYCMAACPYGSRSFNWMDPRPYIHPLNPDFPTRTKGVVEKCNFCEERLAAGRPPACVETCPQKALTFGDLNDENSPLRALLRTRFAVQRQPEMGTGPSIFYLV